jgi:hypothetical protein
MVDEQYIAAYITAYPADKGNVLISNRNTGRPDLLSEQLFGVLRQADRFDTVAGHAKRLIAAGWEDDGSGFIESGIRELITRSLMIPKSAFLASLVERVDRPHAPPPVNSIIIPTRDRVPQLQRCLESWIESNRRHDRQPDYIVLDDSRHKNTTLLDALKPLAAGGARIFSGGMKEKSIFADEIVRTARGDGLPADVVSFALFGDEAYTRTLGANRNALLLASPGELVVMSDDDTVCQSALLGELDATLALSSSKDPTVSRFYADRSQLTESVRTAQVDILACHEKLLGRTIAACLAVFGAPVPGRTGGGPVQHSAVDLGGINPESAHFFGNAQKVVRATASGYWGDSGMEAPHQVLELMGESRDLLMQSSEQYAMAKLSREVFRSVSRYTISDGAVFVPMNAGVDNRSLLPPFFPVGRNSDGIFAMTLRVCAHDALIGHVPIAVLHSPQESRRYAQDSIQAAVAPRLSEIVQTITNTFGPVPGRTSVSERLSDLGRLFVDVGSQKIADFKAYVETIWVGAASRYIVFLEHLLDQYHGEPDYWTDDVLSFVDKLADFTIHGSAAVPRELLETYTTDEAVEICRRVVRKYGELLQWWPAIYEAASDLRGAGVRLAQPV